MTADVSRDDVRERAHAAVGHLLAGLATGGDDWTVEDLPALEAGATVATYRILVAAAAVGSGRVAGEWPPADLDGVLDRVGAAYPGWLMDDDADHPGVEALTGSVVAPDRRREAVRVLSTVVDDGAAAGVPLGTVHEHLLGVEARPAEGADGDLVLTGGEWNGPAVALAAGDDRADGGAYYTPPAVVEGVVEAAVSPVADRIRSGEPGTTAGVPEVRVLDPAVGTGRFLVEVVERLAAAVRDRPGEAGDHGRADLRRRIAENCVYGVDVDPLAVELARATLWLHTGGDGGANLRVGDALLGPGPDTGGAGGSADGSAASVEGWDPVDWPAAFPEILGDGGRFDAVVGNPPYRRSRTVPEPVRSALRERYRTVRGTFDLYVPFLERAAAVGDRVALVVPNKWTTAEYGRDLRAALREDWGVETVVDCSELGLFADADVYPVVVAYAPGEGGKSPPGDRPSGGVRIRTAGDPADVADGNGTELRVPGGLLDRLGGVFPVEMDPELLDSIDRVLRECGRFGDVATAAEGIHTGNVREKLVVEEPVDDRCRPLADGRSIERYRVESSGEWVRYDPDLVDGSEGEYADLRDRSLFEGPKLLVRDISDRPVAAHDDRGLYALNTLYAVHPTGDLPAKYLLAVLNSAFVDRFFRAAYGGTHVRDGYLRFKPTYLDRVPVPAPEPERLPASTRRRLASHPATAAGDPKALDAASAVTDAVGSLTDVVAGAKSLRAGVETDPARYFDPAAGRRLGDLPGTRRAPGAEGTPLVATTRDLAGLRVGRASVGTDGGDLLVRATARYKPGDDDPGRGTDRWGYVETEPIPALRVDRDELDLEREAVLRAVLPGVVDGDLDGPRTAAAETISPLDRIERVGVPEPGAVGADLAGYRAARRRSGALARQVAVADALLDRTVADLYGLDEAERSLLDRPRDHRG